MNTCYPFYSSMLGLVNFSWNKVLDGGGHFSSHPLTWYWDTWRFWLGGLLASACCQMVLSLSRNRKWWAASGPLNLKAAPGEEGPRLALYDAWRSSRPFQTPLVIWNDGGFRCIYLREADQWLEVGAMFSSQVYEENLPKAALISLV